MDDHVVALIVMWVLIVAAFVQLPGYWSGVRTYRMARRVRKGWPFGDRVLLGFLRAIHVFVVTFAVFLLATSLAELDRILGPLPAFRTVSGGLFWAVLGLLAVILSVAVFSAPRFLVPPSVRGCRTLQDVLERDTTRTGETT